MQPWRLPQAEVALPGRVKINMKTTKTTITKHLWIKNIAQRIKLKVLKIKVQSSNPGIYHTAPWTSWGVAPDLNSTVLESSMELSGLESQMKWVALWALLGRSNNKTIWSLQTRQTENVCHRGSLEDLGGNVYWWRNECWYLVWLKFTNQPLCKGLSYSDSIKEF